MSTARAFRRAAARLERKRWRESVAMMRELAARPGGVTYKADLYPVSEALADPRIGEGVHELVMVSYASIGAEPGHSHRECFCCCQPWSASRVLCGVVMVEFLDEARGLVAGVCDDCIGRPNVRSLIVAGLVRDVGGDARSMRPIHEPGRA